MELVVRALLGLGLVLPQLALLARANITPRRLTLVRTTYDKLYYLVDSAFRVLILVFAIFGWQVPWTVMPLPAWLALAGAVGFALTNALVLWARLALGPNLIPGPGYREHHTLTTSGPYKYVRHPMYACYFAAALTAFLATGDWLVGVLGVAAAVGYATFANVEERLLRQLLPRHAYHDYAARTGKFLPRMTRP